MRGGQILMELPANLVARRRQDEYDKARGEVQTKLAQLSGRSFKDRPGTQERRGSTTREFGPILQNNETLYQGQLVGGHVIPGSRTVGR